MDRIMQRLERLYLRADRFTRGWLTVLVRTATAFDQDNGAVMSRSIAYYALFSLFPLLLVLMSFFSSVLALEEAQQLVVDLVDRYMPTITDAVQANLQQALEARNTIGILATVGLLWSASGVFTAIYRSVNRAWGNPKSQLFWSEKLYGIAVVLLVGLFLIGTTIYSTVISVFSHLRVALLGGQPSPHPGGGGILDWLSVLLPAAISVVTFTILYRTIPRNRVTWGEVWRGGVLAGLIWEAAWQLYAWYLSNFARYSLIYGSVGAVIGFMLWSYLSAMILLVGAEFAAQHTHWRRAGCPIEARPLREWLPQWSKQDLQWKNQ